MASSLQEIYELARRPSPEAWRIICQTLDTMALKDAARAILRLKKYLAVWPDELKATMCGMSWDDKFLDGKPDPRSVIVRHLRLDKIFMGRYGSLVIRNVHLDPEMLQRLGHSRGSRHLTMLTISGHHLGAPGMRQLAEAEHLTGLRHLKANRCHIGRHGFEALVRAPFFAQLESLSLDDNDFDEKALDILATLSKPISLQSLSLDDNPLGRVGAAYLAGTPAFSSLTKLSLTGCSLGPEGAKELAEAMLPALENLDVSKNRLGDTGLAELTSRPHAVRQLDLNSDTIGLDGIRALGRSNWPLQSLSLRENRIDDEAAAAIADTKWPALGELTLDDNDIGPVGLEKLLASTTLSSLAQLSLGTNLLGPHSFGRVGAVARHLRKIKLSHNRLGDDGLSSLCRAPWETLSELDLGHNGIHASGFEQLTRASFFDQVTHLDLSNNPLGPHLPKIVWPAKLEVLNLSDTHVGDEVIEALASSSCRPRTLILRGCGLTDRGAIALAKSPILERIERLILDDNAIESEGALVLARAVQGPEVRVLSLEKNKIAEPAVVDIARLESLVVFLDQNPFGDQGRRALDEMPPRCCP